MPVLSGEWNVNRVQGSDLVSPSYARLGELVRIKQKTVEYLQTKIIMEDWHGVADAAMDIRDFEAEMKGIELALG